MGCPVSTNAAPDRASLRKELLRQRREFVASPAFADAEAALGRSLLRLLAQLEPQCLGLYWPLEGEFNAAALLGAAQGLEDCTLALPFARKADRQMDFRRWDGQPPAVQDECGIPSSAGAIVQPDVLLVPCVGFSTAGYRLGYGGGYYDRWLAAHPGVTTVGLAWQLGEIALDVQPHDQALTVILTESALLAP